MYKQQYIMPYRCFFKNHHSLGHYKRLIFIMPVIILVGKYKSHCLFIFVGVIQNVFL